MDRFGRGLLKYRVQNSVETAYTLMGAADHEGHGGLRELYGPPPPHLKIFCDVVRKEIASGTRRQIMAAPTGSLKSTAANILMLQDLMRVNPKVLFATMSGDVRDATTSTLRHTVKMVYGAEGEIWRNDKFTLPSWTPGLKWPNYLGATSSRGIEGYRANIGIGDDISDQKSEFSQAYREQVSRFLHRTLVLRMDEDDNGRLPIVIWGSLWHIGDIIVELIEQGWRAHVFPLFRAPCPTELQRTNVVYHGEEYDHLWKERHGDLTPEQYMDREKMTVQTFQLRCQCNPWGATGRVYDPIWINRSSFSTIPEEVRGRLEISVGDDPRDPSAAKGSEASITILGYDPQGVDRNGERGVIYVLENRGGFWDWPTMEAQVGDIIATWKPKVWTVERSPISGGYVGWLRHHTPLMDHQIIEQPTGGEKMARLCAPAPHVRSGKIRINTEQCPELTAALLALPGGKLLDRPDSMEIGCRRLIEGGVRPNYKPGFGYRI